MRFLKKIPQSLVKVVKRNPIKSIGLVGLGTSMITSQANQKRKQEEFQDKKKILVLPFHRMKIVEEKKNGATNLITNGSSSSGGANKTIEIPIDELVTLIHKAAEDPNVVGLYGIFGHGYTFQTGGWAHIQELRNALAVFQQSHRIHKEPNRMIRKEDNNNNSNESIANNKTLMTATSTSNQEEGQSSTTSKRRKRKVLYAYSNSFASPMPGADGGMKEYYLASIFSPFIHLQPQGDLNLFGMHTTNTFYKNALQKYGIQVDIYKHGQYKNFANQFHESHYTKAHKENVVGIMTSIQNQVLKGIYTSRQASLKNFEFSNFWNMVMKAGSLPAETAYEIGFIDYMPRKDPLQELLANNKQKKKNQDDNNDNGNKQDKEENSSSNNKIRDHTLTWNSNETDFEQFGDAETKLSITEYGIYLKQQQSKDSKQWAMYKQIKDLSKKFPSLENLFAAAGYSAPYYNIPLVSFKQKRIVFHVVVSLLIDHRDTNGDNASMLLSLRTNVAFMFFSPNPSIRNLV